MQFQLLVVVNNLHVFFLFFFCIFLQQYLLYDYMYTVYISNPNCVCQWLFTYIITELG